MSFNKFIKPQISDQEILKKSEEHFLEMQQRRSIRNFDTKPVAIEVIENIVKTAGTAPSGANKQPWTFVVVSDPLMKKQIRIAAEQEEYESYNGRMGETWLKDLEPFGTDWHKPFLEDAPYLIIVFKRVYEFLGEKTFNNYYVNESVGIACGMLITAIHHAGLQTLTHTPSPMAFLTKVLDRPSNERPFLVLPVGHAANNAEVPVISKKSLNEIMVRI